MPTTPAVPNAKDSLEQTARSYISSLTEGEREALVRSVPLLKPPEKTSGLYWLIIGSMVLVMVLCVLSILGIIPTMPSTSKDTVVGVLTTILSFIGGLLAPSPLKPSGASEHKG